MSKASNPHEWMRISAGWPLPPDWTSQGESQGETEGVLDKRQRELIFLIRRVWSIDVEPINESIVSVIKCLA